MNLKNKFFYPIFLFAIALVSCEYQEDNFNFDNSLPQYVDLSSSGGSYSIDTTMANGMVVAVVDSVNTSLSDLAIASDETVRLRVARTSDTNVQISVSGDITETLSTTIPAGELNGSFSVAIPFASKLSGSATATISTVDGGLTIGRAAGADVLDKVSVDISWSAE